MNLNENIDAMIEVLILLDAYRLAFETDKKGIRVRFPILSHEIDY